MHIRAIFLFAGEQVPNQGAGVVARSVEVNVDGRDDSIMSSADGSAVNKGGEKVVTSRYFLGRLPLPSFLSRLLVFFSVLAIVVEDTSTGSETLAETYLVAILLFYYLESLSSFQLL